MLKEQLELTKAQAWADIKEAHRHRNKKYIMSAKAIGLETLELGDNKQEALKLFYDGIYGYIPKSKMDDYEFRSLQSFIGGTFEFIVTDLFEVDGQRLFLGDRKAALEVQAEKFWKNVKVAQEYDAFVSGVDRYNVYLMIQGVRVRMEKMDYSYEFHPDIQEVVFIGDTFKVRVTDVDVENKKVDVSKRVLETDPSEFVDEYKRGGSYLGSITNIDIDYGVFVRLEPYGLTGLAPFPTTTLKNMVQIGQQVNFKVTQIIENKGHIRGIIIIPRAGQINKARGRVNGR
ncbi:S1 RNA-binding domain-containing protein [Rummeliibacillus stabekisii]|uniref:S1 RNA-binding domain-containing protein n=1 Tax=Rummeliibacillus stabekisii TaxID=241244 RepID=UPI003723FC7A